MKKSGAFLDEWGREKAKERYGKARGGEVEPEQKPDAVGGPATDSDLAHMDLENFRASADRKVKPDEVGDDYRKRKGYD